MSTEPLVNIDSRVRDAVLRQLEWALEVDVRGVRIAAKDGDITLTGHIDTFSAKLTAERKAKRVRGVKAVTNDIEVRPKLDRNDADIAADVAHAFALRSTIPDSVQAAVDMGRVTLTGKVDRLFHAREAERAVRDIRGVRGILNRITVAPSVLEEDVHGRIGAALHRTAEVDARHITVSVSGGTAILTGRCRSWLQRESAEEAAADAPGVTRVENLIVVEPPWLDARPDEMC
jgi:osmotically-inducible protein OsmY